MFKSSLWEDEFTKINSYDESSNASPVTVDLFKSVSLTKSSMVRSKP